MRLSSALALFALLSLLVPGARAEPSPPRLGVLIVVDQLRSEDVDRLEPVFGPGGFGGLMHRGAARFDARYPFSAAETSPGHATLGTGAGPSVHGIIVNHWWQDGGLVYSAFDPEAKVLGGEGLPGRGPAQLRVGTLGDAMKIATLGEARVVSVGIKDRAAILTGGFSADLALWYEAELGRFTTSTAYREALPAWLKERIQPRVEQSLKEGRWSPLLIPAGAEALFPPDDAPGESEILGGRTFPHDLASEPDEAKRRRYYRGTPQAVEDLFALALAAIDEEGLGQDDIPDLLIVCVSPVDYVGHWFGPLSLEMTDILRRTDRALRRFLDELDRRFGARVAIVVTSDHGSAPLSQRVERLDVPAGRIDVQEMFQAVNESLREVTGEPKDRVRSFLPPHLWLDLDDLDKSARARALAAVRRTLEGMPGIAATYLPDEPPPQGDPLAALVYGSTYPGRNGDVLVLQRPRFTFDHTSSRMGTDHGTAYAYDGRVPLWVVGPGVRRGRYAEPQDPRSVAPTLAFLLRVPPPDGALSPSLFAVGAR